MKILKILALFTGALVIPLAIREAIRKRARDEAKSNLRYDIDDYLTEHGL